MSRSEKSSRKEHRRFDSDGSPIVPVLRKDNPDTKGLVSGDHDIYPSRHRFSPSHTPTRSRKGSSCPSTSSSASASSRTATPSADRQGSQPAASRGSSTSPVEGRVSGDYGESVASGVDSSSRAPLTREQQHQIITRYYYTKTMNWAHYRSAAGDSKKKETMEEIEARAQFQESTAAHLMELASTMSAADEQTKQAMQDLLGEGIQALGLKNMQDDDDDAEGDANG